MRTITQIPVMTLIKIYGRIATLCYNEDNVYYFDVKSFKGISKDYLLSVFNKLAKMPSPYDLALIDIKFFSNNGRGNMCKPYYRVFVEINEK